MTESNRVFQERITTVLEAMKHHFSQIQDNIDKINAAIRGNSGTGLRGMEADLSELSVRISKLEGSQSALVTDVASVKTDIGLLKAEQRHFVTYVSDKFLGVETLLATAIAETKLIGQKLFDASSDVRMSPAGRYLDEKLAKMADDVANRRTVLDQSLRESKEELSKELTVVTNDVKKIGEFIDQWKGVLKVLAWLGPSGFIMALAALIWVAFRSFGVVR
jgi:archaellum component FlaC